MPGPLSSPLARAILDQGLSSVLPKIQAGTKETDAAEYLRMPFRWQAGLWAPLWTDPGPGGTCQRATRRAGHAVGTCSPGLLHSFCNTEQACEQSRSEPVCAFKLGGFCRSHAAVYPATACPSADYPGTWGPAGWASVHLVPGMFPATGKGLVSKVISEAMTQLCLQDWVDKVNTSGCSSGHRISPPRSPRGLSL